MSLELSMMLINDWWQDKPFVSRHPLWPDARRTHLKSHGKCEICNRKDKLEVHHEVPVHVDPQMELDPSNMITLCDPGDGGCHRRWGHLLLWSSYNPDIRQDIENWKSKVFHRPKIIVAHHLYQE